MVSVNTVQASEKLNPLDYSENSKDRYIASLASSKGLSFEKAKELAEKESAKIVLRGPDGKIVYRTVHADAGGIYGSKGSAKVRFATEMRCVMNVSSGQIGYVESFGAPYAYLPGFKVVSFSHGGFNINRINNTKARISTTGAVKFSGSVSIGVGIDILSISGSANFVHTSKAKTFVANMGF